MRWILFLMVICYSMYGWYGDFGVYITPSYVVINDSENTLYGSGIYNFEGWGKLFFSPQHFAEVSIDNTLLVRTNITNS